MNYGIGIDVGGTFTDFWVTGSDGSFSVHKTPTTPEQPEVGAVRGLQKIAATLGYDVPDFLGRVGVILHGTTITTNAVLTGNGGKTALLTTKGFRDLLNMRRGLRDRQYDTKQRPPDPLVPRRRIHPIEERVNVEGEAVVPLNEADVHAAVERLRSDEVEAVAVSYLWSFLDPAHEQRTGRILRDALPDVYVSLSSEVLPQIRAYERRSTTVLNAAVGPPLARYLDSLVRRLEDAGFRGVLLVMQSNGGVLSPELTARFAANTLLSGPAGGATAGVFYGATHGLRNVLSVDMGGTSFDVCPIHDGRPATTTEGSVGGHRIALPILDIHTIGAGGGSIARIDASGMLRVGPQSAGARPGPVCYGGGGAEPTLTDADLALGYLDPHGLLGGEVPLDAAAAKRAIVRRIAEPLHAGMLARELEVRLVVVPRQSSACCSRPCSTITCDVDTGVASHRAARRVGHPVRDDGPRPRDARGRRHSARPHPARSRARRTLRGAVPRSRGSDRAANRTRGSRRGCEQLSPHARRRVRLCHAGRGDRDDQRPAEGARPDRPAALVG